MTAIREANQGFGKKIQPCVLCSYDVDCDDVVDLANEAARTQAEIPFDAIATGWFTFIAEGRKPPQWALVRRLRAEGAAGVLVPSFAQGSGDRDRNLVLWHWNATLPHRVRVIDAHERLPKDARSWE